MRRAIVLVVTTAALACGGSNSNDDRGVRGTVGGRSFGAVEARAVTAGSGATACNVANPSGGGTIPVGISGLKLDLTSYANVCADYATPQCKVHASAQSVTLIFARLSGIPPFTAPPIAPGTYQVRGSLTTAIPDPANPGLLTVAYAQALGTDAACAGAPSPVQSGTLRIDQVSDTAITGGVNLTFVDGSAVVGDFSAPTCPGVAFDVCQLAATQTVCVGPTTPACL